MAKSKRQLAEVGDDFDPADGGTDAQDMRNYEAARVLMEVALDREMTKINRAFRNAEGLKGAKLVISLAFVRDKTIPDMLDVKVDSATTLKALTAKRRAYINNSQLQMRLPGVADTEPRDSDPAVGGTSGETSGPDMAAEEVETEAVEVEG